MPPLLRKTVRVGFLFNHDASHQVAHIAPIIAAFRTQHPCVHVMAFVSSEEQRAAVVRIVQHMGVQGFACVLLKTPEILRKLFGVLNSFGPFQRLYLLRKYLPLLSKLECLVVPEMTSARLRSNPSMKATALVLVPHGAGDRAVGFCKEIKEYDLVLLSGPKVRDRMLAADLITKEAHRVIGYPKFDTMEKDARSQIFANDRPTVLYNPHFEPRLSSWYTMGKDVFEYFANNSNFNLVVAPHVMLFKKRLHISLATKCMRFVRGIAENYANFPNIKFDAGSPSSVNMRYVLNSDIYLGDVSSQVYEFIHHPRPCIFLNSHDANWQADANYRHWRLGPVLNSVTELDGALATAELHRADYLAEQRLAFAETFDLSSTPSSERAAQVILEFLNAKSSIAPFARATPLQAVRQSTYAPNSDRECI